MQQAYFSENNQIGGWDMIGYIAPNGGETTNFYYGAAIAHSGSASQNAQNVVGWAADNKVTLNKCVAGTVMTEAKATNATTNSHWIVKVSVNTGSQADVTFDASANSPDCVALTPTFDKIGK